MDRDDIQGFALVEPSRVPFARFHFLSFGGAATDARRLLSRLVYDVCSAAEWDAPVQHAVALSARGLLALGLSEAELAQFSLEFRQGMTHPERALALGDDASGLSPPPASDALWLSFAPSAERRAERGAEHERLFERFAVAGSSSDAEWVPNPNPESTRRRRRKARLALGEIVLGERDGVGLRTRGPFVIPKLGTRALPARSPRANEIDLGRNGSYLVLRRSLAGSEDSVSTLVRDFSPRMVCRGFLSTGSERGRESWLAALNVDIRRQFELAQQERTRTATRDGEQFEISASDPNGATRNVGDYFFLPSLRALNYLAEPGA